MSDGEIGRGTYTAFLREHYHDEIEALADAYPDEYALTIDWEELAEFDLSIARHLLGEPDELDVLRDALANYQHAGVDLYRVTMYDELEIEPCLVNLPERWTFGVGDYRHTELNRLIEVEGQVTKRTEVNPMLTTIVYRCMECGGRTFKKTSPTGHGYDIDICEHCFESGPFTVEPGRGEWTDHQLVRVQTPPEDATDGTENIHVHLMGPLTGIVEGGDRVRIAGEFIPVPTKDPSPVYSKTLIGRGVRVEDASFEEIEVSGADVEEIEALARSPDIFAKLRQSIAAAHKGDPHLKDAIVLQLFGDFSREGPDGAHHRGKSHILLIGDPGAGKTLLLSGAAHASPRSAYTDGMNSTAAGLTAAMVRDDFGQGDGWSIEAGTIVRANKGMAVIDELDKAKEKDLDALHTALESEKVPVSKAGKSAILPASTALLAAGNPTGGHFDPSRPFEEQIQLKSPLLSRFDLIFAVREKTDDATIREIARHMARARDAAGYFHRDDLDLSDEQRELIEPEIPHKTLRRYIAYATRKFEPVAESEAVLDRISDEFTAIKSSLPDRYSEVEDESRSGMPVTARKQQAIQRYAAASARVRLSSTYSMEDVERAVRLVRRSLRDIGVLEGPTAGSTASTSQQLTIEDVGLSD